MSCDFKAGDEVVCVDASVALPGGGIRRCAPPLIEGRVYTVERISFDPHDPIYRDVPLLVLIGVMSSGSGDGYLHTRFRKVERRTDKLSLTEWLSQPSGDTDKLDKTRSPAKRRERA